MDKASSSISGINSGLRAVDSSVAKMGRYTLYTTAGGMEINVEDIASHMDNATATKDKESSQHVSIGYKATLDIAIVAMTRKKD